jgi:hypothetical protein
MAMVIEAGYLFPSIVAQNAGREIYHGRQDMVKIVGDENSLQKIAWIFSRVPDMFDVQRRPSFLVVRRAKVDNNAARDLDKKSIAENGKSF